ILLVAREVGLVVTCVALFGLVAAWLGSVADSILVSPSNTRRLTTLQLVLAAVGLFVASRGVAFMMRKYVLEAFRTPSGGMQPAILLGDHFFSDKIAFRKRAPARGEILVFDYPERHGQTFAKRIVGIGGDRIEVRSGHLFVNGWEAPRCDAGTWEYTD